MALPKLVTSCMRLPTRKPSQFKKPKIKSVVKAMALMLPESAGEKFGQIFADRDRDESDRRAHRQPVAPADDKTAVIAKGAPRVNIPAARRRQTRAELGDGDRAENRVHAAEHPDAEDQPDDSRAARRPRPACAESRARSFRRSSRRCRKLCREFSVISRAVRRAFRSSFSTVSILYSPVTRKFI